MTFPDIQDLRREVWKIVDFDESIHQDECYYVSNHGRLVRVKNAEPYLFKPYIMHGYPYFRVKKKEAKKFKTFYLHKVIATHFLEKVDGVCVIHLDYDKKNNHVSNLKWATKREKEQHQWKNPEFVEAVKNKSRSYAKLTENNVRLIKKMINDPNRRTRLKIIAKRFGITTMQLRRIKTGENWGDIPPLS
ncbi:HNH endonuclease [Winogradskyella ursingii]|uniref:HNH endonuclease n=1 Tax=Winogradskyella ursingii TaxID=2686079 RepID=UPI0015CEC524|nr:HNH endonuclease [Winogradskyella ursingii]